ncbi:MAG: TonB-dependent receptor [Gemmatimonadetes bacterium]|nr:TonB-dependent receptor [Gemmatimonadota bacterium]
MIKVRWKALLAALVAVATTVATAGAQVTTGSISGSVTAQGAGPVSGARVIAVHQPSGTTYSALSRADGQFNLPAVRVGGPYTVSVRMIGFAAQSKEGVVVQLGLTTDVAFVLQQAAVKLQAVAVTAEAGTMSSTHTGAATSVSSEAIAAFPTISRVLTDFTRLTPQASGSSFAGMDTRYNNITIDGSYFNNSFGLAGQPGGRTGVSPIPMDAVDQIQVNIAPFDVRQGWFVGAGVNAVTKSGTNEFSAATYYITRDQHMVGNNIDGVSFVPAPQNFAQRGLRVSGPIIKNKLFFFVNWEKDEFSQPITTLVANTGGQPVTGNTTRVLQSDLDQLSSYLQSKFNWNGGAYQGYNRSVPSERLLYKIDWNINDRNKLSFRYNKLDSQSDQPISGSSSLGFGNRITTNSLSFANSGYSILENIRSGVGELNSQITDNLSNDLIIGYTKNDESRGYKSQLFPLVDILQNNTDYISFGMDPFTPNNQLRYHTFQIQDNVSYYVGQHSFTFGATYEKYHSDNVFYQGAAGVWVYNSLSDFYADANDFLANPNRTVSPVKAARYQVQYVNVPGMTEPLQPLDVQSYGGYAQDDWRVTPRLKITGGVRMDIVSFGNTALENVEAAGMTFRDKNGNPVQYHTGNLPGATPLFSPRVGFNWDVHGDKSTQVRGGTGIFTGKPAYVWISNQIGNNGMLTGAIDASNTNAYPFNPDPNKYHVQTVTGAPAPSYTLNFTDPGFKFPQLWRSDIAVDQKLPGGWIGTAELLYGRDVNGMYYTNANLPAPAGMTTGADVRPYWNTANFGNRINTKVNGAYVLQNENSGYSLDYSVSVEKAFENGFFAKLGYNYGLSMNTHDPGSIAAGNWTGNPISGNPNNAPLGYSQYSPGHRYFVALSYKHDYFSWGRTTISTFLEGFTQGNDSYTFSGDANGDGAFGNDLIYVPRNQGEMNFVPFTSGGTTFTAAQQAAAWDAYIAQDPYLSKRRGQYAERGGIFLPMLLRDDLSFSQDIATLIGGKRNSLEVRLDILNFTNMLNNRWGVSQRLVSNAPLIPKGRDANGALTYTLRNFGSQLMSTTFQNNAGLADAYRMQLGFRYNFN